MVFGTSIAGSIGSWDIDAWEQAEIALAKAQHTPLSSAIAVLDNRMRKYQRERYHKAKGKKVYTLFGAVLRPVRDVPIDVESQHTLV